MGLSSFSFSSNSLIADGPHHYHPACGHKGSSHLSPVHALQFFYRDASSALLQLVNQWLNFTYSRSHAFRYERKNTNPTLARIELKTSALAGVQITYYTTRATLWNPFNTVKSFCPYNQYSHLNFPTNPPRGWIRYTQKLQMRSDFPLNSYTRYSLCRKNRVLYRGYSRVTRFSLSMEMSRLTRDGMAEPGSREQIILRHTRGQGNIYFPCPADHEQDWQPYPVDLYSAICDDYTHIHNHTYLVLYVVHTYIHQATGSLPNSPHFLIGELSPWLLFLYRVT